MVDSKLQKSLTKMYESSYTNICQIENLSDNPLAHFQLYIEDKQKYLFKSNYNSNASFIKLKTGLKYLKFSLSINLITKEDKKEIRNHTFQKGILSLFERGLLNRTTVEVYAGGVKLPDDTSFITIYDGSIDLYVPEKYFKNGMYLDIITKKYSKKEKFSNIVIRKVSGNNINFNLLNTKEISTNSIKIYKNGLLLTENIDYQLINFGAVNEFLAIFGANIELTDVIEIQIDPNCIYYKYELEKKDNLLSVPRDILPNLPISLDICRFYSNGKRLFNRDINILAPRNFQIPNLEPNSKVLFFVNYDGDYIDSEEIYHEDGIKAFNSLSEEELNDIFMKDCETKDGLEWIKDLNYPPRPINVIPNPNLLRDRTYEEFVDDTIKEFLQDNPHNIVPLLTEYKNESFNSYTFNVNELNDRSSTKYECGSIDLLLFRKPKKVMCIPNPKKDIYILAFADDIKIDDDLITKREFNNSIFVYIDSASLIGKKQIELKLLPINNVLKFSYNYIVTNEISKLELDKSTMGKILIESDILVMEKTDNGFLLQEKDKDYTIEFTDESINIEFLNKRLLSEFIIYNSAYFYHEVININEDKITSLKLNEKTPFLSNYTFEVYKNGLLMMENVDYFLSNQKTIKNSDDEIIIFKNYPKNGDKLELYHYEVSKLEFSTCEIVNSNKYDLVYFRTDRNFGFGKNYIDLYINDVLVRPNNIREVALNLIAINQEDIPRPYKYVSAKSKFNKDVVNISSYIDYHKKNPSKFAEYIDKLMHISDIDAIDKIISLLYPSINRKPEEIIEEVEERDLIDPLLDEIARRLRLGLMDRRIDCNVTQKIFNQIEWLKYMDYTQRMSTEIALNANINNISELTSLDCAGTLLPVDELTYIVAKEVRDDKFPYLKNYEDMTEEEYNSYPISNKLYLEEIKFANSTVNIPEPIIINCNDGIDGDYTLEKISKVIDNRKIKKIVNPKFIETGNGLQFFYRIDVNNLSIYEFESLYVNNYNETTNIKYDDKLKIIDIYISINDIDKVTVNFKRKVYAE